MLFCTVFSRHCPLSIMSAFHMGAPAINYTLRTEFPCGSYLSILKLHLLNKIWMLVLDHALSCSGTYWYMIFFFVCESFHVPQVLTFILWTFSVAAVYFLKHKTGSDQVKASAWFCRKPEKPDQRKEIALSTRRGVVYYL